MGGDRAGVHLDTSVDGKRAFSPIVVALGSLYDEIEGVQGETGPALQKIHRVTESGLTARL